MTTCYTHPVTVSKVLAFFLGPASLLSLTHLPPPPLYLFPVPSCSDLAFPFNN